LLIGSGEQNDACHKKASSKVILERAIGVPVHLSTKLINWLPE
jgi:hypothetical protein